MVSGQLEKSLASFLARCRTHRQPYTIDIDHLGLDGFVVYPDVLSPKYDIDSKFFRRAVARVVSQHTLLEIGTGSGVVAIHCGRSNAKRIVATDINPHAVRNCADNARRFNLSGPLFEVRQGSLFEPLRSGEKFDLIFWNHPWSPQPGGGNALDSAVFDGDYEQLRRFLREAPKHLTENGKVLLGTSDLCDLKRIERMAVQDYGLEFDDVESEVLTAIDPDGRPFPVHVFLYQLTRRQKWQGHFRSELPLGCDRPLPLVAPDNKTAPRNLKCHNVSVTPVMPAEVRELDVAVVGMSCRLPGADDVDQFWNNLRLGVESIRVKEAKPDSRCNKDVLTPCSSEKRFVPATANLPSVELFDAAFFGISAREAELMDPQHRLFLEESWRAFEHAGYNPRTYGGAVGVFASAGMSNYYAQHVAPNVDLREPANAYLAMIGNDKDYLATRVSYLLDLKGPSMTVQTACSSSLVAVHLAIGSLLNGECDMALAGGVAIPLALRDGYFYQEGMIGSPDGHCRAFDAQAEGTVFGSGLGIVLLKRLEDAINDHDTVHAVIKGSAVNNDGANKAGFTAPGIAGQVAAVTEALAVADVGADSISYVEAHGTGTKIGDPIEIRALCEAFATDRRGSCAVGSVKTNIGHLDAAAGVVGLIKTVSALKHKELPPSLHFNRRIRKLISHSPFFVNDRLRAWRTDGSPRRAGVSSFGIGGTNAHVVLEESPLSVAHSGRPALPKHAFHSTRFWIEKQQEDAREELYEVQWRQQPLEPRSESRHKDAAAETLGKFRDERQVNPGHEEGWLIFADRRGIGGQIAGQLRHLGMPCVLVRAAERFRETPDVIEIDPDDDSSFDQLLEYVDKTNLNVGGVVHLWSLDVCGKHAPSVLKQATRLGCGSVLRFLQAMTSKSRRLPAKIWLVTNGAAAISQSAGDGGMPDLAQSPLWGMSRVMQLEFPEISGGIVDLDDEPDDTRSASLLLQEITSQTAEEQIVYRGGDRYVPRLVARNSFASRPDRLDPQGSYLITGGLGVVGMNVARWMVLQGARHLVLTGRREVEDLPPEVMERVRALRAMGAEVDVVSADVCDGEAVSRLVRGIKRGPAPLRGVTHAAGVYTDRLLNDMPHGELEAVLAPKTIGAWNLHEHTQDCALDFFVCFSSAGSVWGASGQGHYAAANYFLDSLAHYRRSQGLPALSINWGSLATGGICTESYKDWLAEIGVGQIKTPRALELLEYLLGVDAPQVVAVNLDRHKFCQVYNARRRRTLLEPLDVGQVCNLPEFQGNGSVQTCPTSSGCNELETQVRDIVRSVIGFTPSNTGDEDQGFTDMGMDSLLAVSLRSQLEQSFQCTMPATVAFDYPNAKALTGFIARKLFDVPAASDPVPTTMDVCDSPISGGDADADLDVAIQEEIQEIEKLLHD